MRRVLIFIFAIMSVSTLYGARMASFSEVEKRADSLYWDKLTDRIFTGVVEGFDKRVNGYFLSEIKDGLPSGRFWGFYDSEYSVPMWFGVYKRGYREGNEWHYYPDGTLCFRASLKHGKLHGRRECYREDGTLWHIHHYKNEKEDGVRKTFYEGGKYVHEYATYKEGVLHGKFMQYFDDGRLRVRGQFRYGKRDGVWREYLHSGKLSAKVEYVNGVKVE